jgi:hypothetical protein
VTSRLRIIIVLPNPCRDKCQRPEFCHAQLHVALQFVHLLCTILRQWPFHLCWSCLHPQMVVVGLVGRCNNRCEPPCIWDMGAIPAANNIPKPQSEWMCVAHMKTLVARSETARTAKPGEMGAWWCNGQRLSDLKSRMVISQSPSTAISFPYMHVIFQTQTPSGNQSTDVMFQAHVQLHRYCQTTTQTRP